MWSRTCRCTTSPHRSEPQHHTERSGPPGPAPWDIQLADRRGIGMDWAVRMPEQRRVRRAPGRRRCLDRPGRLPPGRPRGAPPAPPRSAGAHGLAGAIDPARRLVVTEMVVRAGGGIVWRREEGGGVRSSSSTGRPMTTGRSPRGSSTRARPRHRRRYARSRRRRGYGAGWAARSGPAPTVTGSDDRKRSATGR